MRVALAAMAAAGILTEVFFRKYRRRKQKKFLALAIMSLLIALALAAYSALTVILVSAVE
jgi:hypothetical protein